MKPVRVRDLPQQPAYGVMLYCWRCGAEFSATRGDYFMADPDTIFRCSCTAGRPYMELVEKQTRHKPITATEGARVHA